MKLLGLVRYETLMHWRRGAIWLAVALVAVILLCGPALFKPLIERASICVGPEEMCRVTPAVTSLIWQATLMLVSLSLPVLFAETIPLDRHYNVCDLLDSLPLTRGTYLTGKVAGAWASGLLPLAGVALLDGVFGRGAHGPSGVGNYLVVWGLGLMPLVIYLTAFSVLLASGLATRRFAGFIGVGVAALIIFSPLLAFQLPGGTMTLWPHQFLVRQFGLVQSLAQAESGLSGAAPAPFARQLLSGVLQIALVWLAAWGWRQWRKARV